MARVTLLSYLWTRASLLRDIRAARAEAKRWRSQGREIPARGWDVLTNRLRKRLAALRRDFYGQP